MAIIQSEAARKVEIERKIEEEKAELELRRAKAARDHEAWVAEQEKRRMHMRERIANAKHLQNAQQEQHALHLAHYESHMASIRSQAQRRHEKMKKLREELQQTNSRMQVASST